MQKVTPRSMRIRRRTSHGALGSLLTALLCLVSFMIAAVAVDVAKGVWVRAELQTAADAGALAGAQILAKTGIVVGDSSTKTAVSNALYVCGLNNCDSQSVQNSTPHTTVTATYALNVPYNNSTSNTVTVTCTRYMPTIFAKLLNAYMAPVSARATAAAFRGISQLPYPPTTPTAGALLPITPSLNYVPVGGDMSGTALESLAHVGTPIGKQTTFVLNGNGQEDAAWIKSQGNGASNPSTISVGDMLQLTNGVEANVMKQIVVGDTYLVPIIVGSPPYNKQFLVVGFMAFTVTNIDKTGFHSITGTISPAFPQGLDQAPPTSSLLDSDGLSFINATTPFQVELIN
jgi:hypothetical protein